MVRGNKALIWFAPVIVFPVFLFFVSGSVTNIILINRGVLVEGVTIDANIYERRIVYEYSFESVVYRNEYKFNGAAPSPLVDKKLNITVDPQNPKTHRIFDPAEGLRTILFAMLLIFIATFVFFVIFASNGFRSPFAKADTEAVEKWDRHKNDLKK